MLYVVYSQRKGIQYDLHYWLFTAVFTVLVSVIVGQCYWGHIRSIGQYSDI